MKNCKRKPKNALNFLVSESTLKKSKKRYTLMKNFLTKRKTEEQNQGINQ